MRFISWNVNGLRACLTKGFPEFFQQIDADIFCLQETKLQQGQVEMVLPGYRQYWNSAVKKGYSGTAVFSKKEPLSVSYGLGIEEHDQEGRVITLEFPAFYLTTVYTVSYTHLDVYKRQPQNGTAGSVQRRDKPCLEGKLILRSYPAD